MSPENYAKNSTLTFWSSAEIFSVKIWDIIHEILILSRYVNSLDETCFIFTQDWQVQDKIAKKKFTQD